MKTLCPAEPGELPPREGEDVWHGRDWGRRLRDQVNQHLVRVFGSVLLAEVISAGVQLSQIPDLGRGFGGQRRRAGPDLGRADPSRHQCRADDRDPARLRVHHHGDPGSRVPGPYDDTVST